MNRRYLRAVLAVAVFAGVAGCAGKPFSPAFQPQVGDRHYVDIATDTSIRISLQGLGADLTITNTVDMGLDMTVTEVRPEGGAKMEVTIGKVNLRQGAPKIAGMDLGALMGEAQRATSRAFAKARGHKFTVTVMPDGTPIPGEGMRGLAESVLEGAGLDEMSEMGAQLARDAVTQGLSAESLEQSVRQIFAGYRGLPTKVGEAWTKNESIDVPMPIQAAATYTLESLDEASFGVSRSAQMAASGLPRDLPGMADLPTGVNLDLKLHGLGNSTLRMDRQSTWPKAIETNFDLKGMLTAGGPGGGMTIDMSILGKETITVTRM